MPETANERESQAQATRNESRKSFTGRARRHRNRWSVRMADATARWLITIGGVGTIVAVLLVFAFLLSVVLPLFWPPPSVTLQAEFAAPWTVRVIATNVNEYRSLAWALQSDGRLVVYRADTGEQLGKLDFCTDGQITAVAAAPETGRVVLGFVDGTIRLARIRFTASFVEPENVPAEFRDLPDDAPRNFETGLLQRTPQGQLRVQTVEATLEEPLEFATGPVRFLDHVSVSDDSGLGLEPTIAAWVDGGKLVFATTRHNELTERHKIDEKSEVTLDAESGAPAAAPSESRANAAAPNALLLTSRANDVLVAYPTGQVFRYGTLDPTKIELRETAKVLNAGTLTCCSWVLGRETMLCGDDQGHVAAWFLARPTAEGGGNTASGDASEAPASDESHTSSDGRRLVRGHLLKRGPAAVSSLSRSQRGRLAVAGFADGSFAVHQVTTENRLLEQRVPSGKQVAAAVLTPKDDGLVTIDAAGRVAHYALNPRHPEVTWGALFRPVWYEGYDRPAHVWQSSFAGIEPEMKLGLWPLVSGTLKATFYSMVLGVPIALLAAIYTSEFMSPGLRAKVKPSIEMMASLPSVVLGFLAALVFAPVVEQIVPQVLTSFVTVPLAFLIGAALWQLAPTAWGPYLAPYRFIGIATAFAGGVSAAWLAGDSVERWLFAGDIMRWLDGQAGDGSAAWLIVLLPTLAVLAAIAVTAWVNPWMRRAWGDWSRPAFGALNLVKIVVTAVLTISLAYGLAELLTAAGWDLRGTIVSTYVQRNALVVGFVMGFAIIPLIYTIADDALSTVPQHLRSASLGAGATPWQTAVRVVIPTAMSGLFSALMIGLGRAVGETMIVLMAGGNTPVTDWNVFSGFRTLSANIAVELPEAVRDSTHYRTLFLAALTLFVLTFLVNTAAEIVRTRFRRRAIQL